MSTDYLEQIKLATADIEKLRKLLKDIDPASGLSVSLRRGVARDNDEVDDDSDKRPWHTMEICENMESIIHDVLEARTNSLQYWLKYGAKYVQDMNKAEADALAVISDLT